MTLFQSLVLLGHRFQRDILMRQNKRLSGKHFLVPEPGSNHVSGRRVWQRSG